MQRVPLALSAPLVLLGCLLGCEVDPREFEHMGGGAGGAPMSPISSTDPMAGPMSPPTGGRGDAAATDEGPEPSPTDPPGLLGQNPPDPQRVTAPERLGSASTSTLSVAAPSVTLGQSVAFELVVNTGAGDPLGHGGDSVAFSVSQGTSQGALGAVVDRGDGSYTAPFTPTLAGTPLLVGATLNGVAVSTPGPSLVVLPFSRFALAFDGVSEFVSLGDVTLASGSLSLWFNTTAAADGYLFSKVQAGGSTQGELRLLLTGGRLVLRLEAAEVSEVQSDGTLNDGRWHHVVAAFNPGLLLFVDGQAQVSRNLDNMTGLVLRGVSLELGRNNALEDDYYAGLLDEVALYDRQLSPTDVEEIYHRGVPGDLNELASRANLARWWRLGDLDAPPVAVDSAGNLGGTLVEMDRDNIIPLAP